MKIILMGVPGHGHVNPTLPIMQRLIAGGVQVLAYNTEDFRAKISATGAEFRAYPDTVLTAESIAHAVETHLVNVTQILFEASLTLTAFMVGEIGREAPDLVIFDSICLWGLQAARISGLPSIASITTFVQEGVKLRNSWRDTWHLVGGALLRLPKLLKARSALVQRYGRASLPEKYIFPCTGHLNIVYTIRELQPPTPVIDATFRFVGPSLPQRDQEPTLPLPDGRVIYISLGTIHTNNLQFFASCFEAFAEEPGCFILSAGAQAEHLKPPANFIVCSHLPQLEVLQRADLFITHAGMNSLHESLYFGVPMVMVPQQMEQVMNARIAQMHDLGIVLGDHPPYGQQVSASMLRTAVATVLAEPRYRKATRRVQQLLQATDGTTEAVEAILEFGARTKRGG
jgi:MGT family glycosyltransferase